MGWLSIKMPSSPLANNYVHDQVYTNKNLSILEIYNKDGKIVGVYSLRGPEATTPALATRTSPNSLSLPSKKKFSNFYSCLHIDLELWRKYCSLEE